MSIPADTVTVSVTKLHELEALQSQLDTLIATAKEEAVQEYKLYKTYIACDREARMKRQLDRYYAKREEINARRRAAYRAKKAAAAAAAATGSETA